MTRKLAIALALNISIFLGGCISFADYESGPQQLFDCKDLLNIVHKGATQQAVEKAFGFPTANMAQMPDGTVKTGLAIYSATRNLTEMRSRQLDIKYDKNKKIKWFKLFTTSHGTVREINCTN